MSMPPNADRHAAAPAKPSAGVIADVAETHVEAGAAPRLPGTPAACVAALAALRAARDFQEAEHLACQALAAFPGAMGVWLEAALIAQGGQYYELAQFRWAELRRRFPQAPAGYLGAIRLAEKLAQPAELDRLIGLGLAAFPTNAELLEAAARSSARRRDWERAAREWQAAIDQDPDNPAIQVAAALSMMGPAPGRQKRLPEVLRRLAAVNAAFPDHEPGYLAHVRALREAKKTEEAAALAQASCRRFPGNQDLTVSCARVLEEAGRADEALALLARAREGEAAPSARLEAAYSRALALSGRGDEAEAVCQAALARFPDNRLVLIEHAALATRRGDWALALRRAQAAQAMRPDDEEVNKILNRARNQVLEDPRAPADRAPAAADDDGHDAAPARAADPGLAAFFAGFESLGATGAGCEFGIVQRRFGAEPFGLMRWAKITIPGLIQALQTRFEGMGLEENTQLVVQGTSADHEEYFIQDSRFGYWTHTFVKVEDAPFERMYKQSVRRVRFLREKLLEDLQAGNKIYVFKVSQRVRPKHLHRLFAALRTYGDCVLLCNTLADAEHPKGSLEMLEEGLFLGRSDSFMDTGIGGRTGVDADQWRAFCEQVAAWRAARLAKAPALAPAAPAPQAAAHAA
jgi:tetratricopeptide (TPR) repeat protein